MISPFFFFPAYSAVPLIKYQEMLCSLFRVLDSISTISLLGSPGEQFISATISNEISFTVRLGSVAQRQEDDRSKQSSSVLNAGEKRFIYTTS